MWNETGIKRYNSAKQVYVIIQKGNDIKPEVHFVRILVLHI